MKKLLKSKKALSPVIAAIILIAVTVAVSIAVAAWMGSLSMGFMETKELTITDLFFETNGNITVSVSNPGTSDVTVAVVKVNGDDESWAASETDLTIESATDSDLTIDMATAWVAGNKYSVSLFATDGTLVASYTETSPA
jgi:flagellin-like protein